MTPIPFFQKWHFSHPSLYMYHVDKRNVSKVTLKITFHSWKSQVFTKIIIIIYRHVISPRSKDLHVLLRYKLQHVYARRFVHASQHNNRLLICKVKLYFERNLYENDFKSMIMFVNGNICLSYVIWHMFSAMFHHRCRFVVRLWIDIKLW